MRPSHLPALARDAVDACNACALVCAGTIPANMSMNIEFFDAGAHPLNLA